MTPKTRSLPEGRRAGGETERCSARISRSCKQSRRMKNVAKMARQGPNNKQQRTESVKQTQPANNGREINTWLEIKKRHRKRRETRESESKPTPTQKKKKKTDCPFRAGRGIIKPPAVPSRRDQANPQLIDYTYKHIGTAPAHMGEGSVIRTHHAKYK